MSELFLKVLNMSISASWLVLTVLLLRFVLKKVPRWVFVLLWGIVALRLVCTVSIESSFSLIPSAETVNPEIMMDRTPSIHTGFTVLDDAINPIIVSSFAPHPAASANPLQILIPVASVIWVAGIALLLLYTAISYLRLREKVKTAVPLRKGIYQSENVSSPFVLGIIKPKIYLPFHISELDLYHVIAHERAHIRRKDHWWKPLGFLLLTIHWFNPLMWLAYVLLCRDIELACDERVIKALGNDQRADYTQALLSSSVNRFTVAACPLAFGEVGVKERVRSIMNYKKPAFWLVLAAVIVCIAVAVCFLTNPKSPEVKDPIQGDVNTYQETTDETWLLDSTSYTYRLELTEQPNHAANDLAYYMELAAQGKVLQNMSAAKQEDILSEYGDLLADFSLVARETADGSIAYIVGSYTGTHGNSPFLSLRMLDFSLPMEDWWQVLYEESDTEAVEQALANDSVPDAGYVIKSSHVRYTSNGEYILIQPRDIRSDLAAVFTKSLTPEGQAYMMDAASRGIALAKPEGPYLEVMLISEKWGEVTEMISLAEEQVDQILSEPRQKLEEGYGFMAQLVLGANSSINIEEDALWFTESRGIPQTVLDFAIGQCGYKFASPKDITNPIVEATLECPWLDATFSASESDLQALHSMLTNAEFGYIGACGYGAKLTVKLSDGTELVLFKGTDDCDSLAFGSYGGYFLGDAENTKFWEIFGLDVITKEPIGVG